MKALVISDTHGLIKTSKHLLGILKNEIDVVFHLGDFCSDLNEIMAGYDIPHYCVRGNCDFESRFPHKALVELSIGNNDKNNDKIKVLLTHGHKFHVKSGLLNISYFAKENSANICLFGHTHMPETEILDNILFLNPGSISLPRGINVPTYGIISIDNREISGRIVGVYGDNIFKPIKEFCEYRIVI